MPSWEEQLQSLRGGGAPQKSWDDQLAGVRGAAPPPSPPPPEESDMSLMERFAQGAREMGRGALYGANQGMMLGGADEAEAAARVAAGGDWQSSIDQARADMRSAREGAPWTFEAARMAGSIPGAAIGGVRAMIPQGIVGGALGSDSDDWRQTASDAASGGLMAGAMGLAGQAVGNAARGAAGWVGDKIGPKVQGFSDWLGQLSNETRGQALGGTAGEFKTLANQRGLDYVEGGLGEAVERQGLTNRVIPQSPSGYARKADAKMAGEIEAKNGALAAAGDELDPGFLPRDALEQGIRGQARNYDGAQGLGLDRDPMLANYDRIAGQVPEQLPEHMSPAQLDAAKMKYYDLGYTQDKIAGTPESYAAQAHQDAGRVAKEQLHGALDYALPETREAFMGANQNIGELATIANMSRGAAARNAAGGGAFVNSLATLGGAALGGSTGNPLMAAAGAYGGHKGLQLAREYGPDFAANMQRLGSDAVGAFAPDRGVRGVADAAGMFGGDARGMAGGIQELGRSSAPGAASNYMASGGGDSAAYERSIADGRGHMLADVVQDSLQNDPQSLGPYANQFAEAMGSRRSGAVSALLSRLSQTDETWRTQYLPALRARTGGGNEF